MSELLSYIAEVVNRLESAISAATLRLPTLSPTSSGFPEKKKKKVRYEKNSRSGD